MGAGAFTVAQAGVSFETPGRAAAMLVVYAAVALVGAGVVALLYRMYFRDAVPEGISAIVGVSLVVVYLNTASLGTIVSGGQLELLQFEVVVFNVVALGAATVSTPVGRRLGDRVGTELFAVSGGTGIEGDVGTIVRSVGRVTPVTLPGEIDDVESYDPVTAQRKAEIADKTLFFPRGLTVAQLRERVIDRLKEDYGVGYVDLDLREDGTVEYLAVGSRAAGIGHTLAPGQVAVAVQSDPAYSASPGDTVQLWTDEGTPSQVVTAQLRATAGDIATVAVEEADAASVDGRTTYRLVTLPAAQRYDREFASLLRASDETMAVVTVESGSELAGLAVGALEAILVALETADGSIDVLPVPERTIEAGETVYAVGRPDLLRRLEERAAGSPAVFATSADGADRETDTE